MERKYRILSIEDAATREAWQRLWEKSPQRSPFSTLVYAEAVSRHFDLELSVLGVVKEGREHVLEAGAILFHRKRGPYHEVVVPPFTPYSPVLLGDAREDASVHSRNSPFEVLLSGIEARFGRIVLHLFPSVTDVRPASWRSWRISPLYTYTAPLEHEERLVARWSEGARRTFKRGKEDFIIAEEAGVSEMVVKMSAQSYERHQRGYPAATRAIRGMIDEMREHKFARLFIARSKATGEPQAGLAVLHDGETGYYWIAGSRPGDAMTILLGNVLPLLHTDGLERFDFIGANTPSIAEFKRRLGAELTPYFRAEKETRPELRLLYRLFRP